MELMSARHRGQQLLLPLASQAAMQSLWNTWGVDEALLPPQGVATASPLLVLSKQMLHSSPAGKLLSLRGVGRVVISSRDHCT